MLMMKDKKKKGEIWYGTKVVFLCRLLADCDSLSFLFRCPIASACAKSDSNLIHLECYLGYLNANKAHMGKKNTSYSFDTTNWYYVENDLAFSPTIQEQYKLASIKRYAREGVNLWNGLISATEGGDEGTIHYATFASPSIYAYTDNNPGTNNDGHIDNWGISVEIVKWADLGLTEYECMATFAHEFGHVYGLSHSNGIMNPQPIYCAPTQANIKAMQIMTDQITHSSTYTYSVYSAEEHKVYCSYCSKYVGRHGHDWSAYTTTSSKHTKNVLSLLVIIRQAPDIDGRILQLVIRCITKSVRFVNIIIIKVIIGDIHSIHLHSIANIVHYAVKGYMRAIIISRQPMELYAQTVALRRVAL